MKNELKELCSRLEGYTDERFLVQSAEKRDDGSWHLEVKLATTEDQEAHDESNE